MGFKGKQDQNKVMKNEWKIRKSHVFIICHLLTAHYHGTMHDYMLSQQFAGSCDHNMLLF